MDYWWDAFGEYEPHKDREAAIKFALNLILADDRLEHLSRLLTDGDSIRVLSGEPGWELERREPRVHPSHYSDWPDNAKFWAHVDPNEFELAHPDTFLTREQLHEYVRKIINVYIAKNPSKLELAERVLSRMTRQPTTLMGVPVPDAYQQLVDRELVGFAPFTQLEPWFFLRDNECFWATDWRPATDKRLLVFARRQDFTNLACFVVDHDNTVKGVALIQGRANTEFRLLKEYPNLWAWLKVVVDDIEEWVAYGEVPSFGS